MKLTTKKIATMGMLCAVAYVVMVLIHVSIIPAAPFLTYDPKDVIIAIGGFIFGPAAAIIISIVVAFLEMITVSHTGIIGMLMQVIATASFIIPASLMYKKIKTRKAAVTGLSIGVVSMTLLMLLWNYLLTPLYLGTPRADVAAMLVPAILPFNLIKGVLNSILTLLIYKPVVKALRRTGMVEDR